ncbi:hypothetical protein KQX54_011252 [Cotesia glomerata]|uniref:Uncharacterized protein n=1 Tax=Cotesia glomerata TaxID=32391 RepID=A0AAV7HWN1_COTGL|nr:hypothetical protein KQX54_011252 [Cotesia glomerata]
MFNGIRLSSGADWAIFAEVELVKMSVNCGIIIPVSPKKVRSEDQDSDQDQDSSFNSTLSTEKSSDDEVHWNDERLENIDIRQE